MVWPRNKTVLWYSNQGDFCGIILMFVGTGYSYTSLKYACGPFVRIRYIFTACYAMACLSFMIVSAKPGLLNSFPRKSAFFSIFFIVNFMPITMIWVWYDPRYMLNPDPGFCAIPIYCYAGSKVFYLSMFPECCSRTGKFDILGASH